MAQCVNCGADIPNGAVFCPNCGAPQQQQQPQKKVISRKTVGGIIAILCVIAAAVAAALIFFNYQKRKIDLEKYISVDYSGGNSKGRAEAVLDKTGLYSSVRYAEGKRGLSDASYSVDSISNSEAKLVTSISIKLDKTENLSNKDVVTADVTFDENIAKECGIRFASTTIKYTVSGLANLTEIDPFADLSVSFSGYSPDLELSMKNNTNNSLLKNAAYKADKTEQIKIGDIVKITVNMDETTLEKQGYMLSQTEKEYEVKSADKYITSLSEISSDFLVAMQKDAVDNIESYIAQYYKNTVQADNWQYLGAYLLTAKDISNLGWNKNANSIFLVYSCNVSSTSNDFASSVNYYPVRFNNLSALASGTQLYDNKDGIYGDSGVPALNYGGKSNGYTDGTQMFKEVVVTQRNDYSYEMSDGLKGFGE